ncbi:T9SS type A sorting domain-containing protein, partial [Gillisia hiemivivida]
PAYTYAWTASLGGVIPSGQASNQDLTGLVAGTYDVVITDANSTTNGCRATKTVVITQPAVALSSSETHVNVLCYGGATGSIDLTPSGGTPAYTYAWTASLGGVIPSGQSSNQDLTGLVAGTYDVVITDANGTTGGCRAIKTVVITQPAAALYGSAVPTAESCAFNDGSIALTVSGGTTPYSYLWNNGAITQNLSGLAAGSYTVTITDANGCEATASATVNAPTNCIVDEGCTPGYWKNHLEDWGSTDPNADFFVFFGIDPVGNNVEDIIGDMDQNADGKLTLLEAISAEVKTSKNNGWFAALARHAVAAYLNASNPDVGYQYGTAYILSETEKVFETNYSNRNAANAAAQELHNLFRIANERVCPLGNSKAQEAALSISPTDNTETSVVEKSFSAYPVPFRETLNIEYDFDYSSSATIQMFDTQGRLLRTYREANAFKGKVTELSIDFRTRASQVYILKVTTDRDVFTKKIISDK